MDSIQKWFNPIYLQFYDEMVHLAFRTLQDVELAKDIAQNAFLTMLIKYDQLRNHPNLHGWLIKTVRYLIMNEQQKAYYSLEVPINSENELVAMDTSINFLSMLPPELSERECQILYLFFEVGFSHETIATQLGCTPEACRMRLYRAKKRCYDFLIKKKKKI